VQGVASGIILMLTGMVIPVSIFPDIVAEIAKLLPVTNGLMALRDTFAGAGLGAVSGELIRETVTGLVYYAVAFGGFCFFERFVKRAGSLDRDAL
jgi:ABC-type polysaccharide/polyol phosphate export permease